MSIELIRYGTDGELANAVATAWLKEFKPAKNHDLSYCVALSGGRIARKLFSATAERAKADKLTLSFAHFFWADERCVAPADPESNFRVARELLFAPLQIPDRHIHRIRGEETPDFAAAEAEAEICRIAPLNSDGQPVLDLILLGMGEDGHVASLFPGEPENTMANPAVYRGVTASKPPPKRITIGYKTIAAARQVWVVASGSTKEAALRESLSPTGRTPLSRVLKSRAATRLYSDIPCG